MRKTSRISALCVLAFLILGPGCDNSAEPQRDLATEKKAQEHADLEARLEKRKQERLAKEEEKKRYRAEFVSRQPPGLPPFTETEHEAANAKASNTPKQRLDIALVIDTTGSMGDELTYLQVEFDALSATSPKADGPHSFEGGRISGRLSIVGNDGATLCSTTLTSTPLIAVSVEQKDARNQPAADADALQGTAASTYWRAVDRALATVAPGTTAVR